MRLQEFQAKRLFEEAGIPVPDSALARSATEVLDAGEDIGYPVAIKAQVRVGGRGKAGGIELVEDSAEAEIAADAILGMDLKGHTVETVLVENALEAEEELYVGVTMDRGAGKPVAMVSRAGGVDVERAGAGDSGSIAREYVDPEFGLHPYQARRCVYDAGIDRSVIDDVGEILLTLYDLWEKNDAIDAEINPLLVTGGGDVVAVDAVFNIDDSARFRHPEFEAFEQEPSDELEARASEYGLEYVRLDGNVGIIGNGAGLVMATLDMVEYAGGSPANFLDIGGGAKADRVRSALELVFSDDNVETVVFNIFGGITRVDDVARGLNQALETFDAREKPTFVRLAGTNSEKGREILRTDRLTLESSLEDAVDHAVQRAREGSR